MAESGPFLNWNLKNILEARGRNRAGVAKEAGLHPIILTQMVYNRAGKLSLHTVAALARVLGIGIAPPPPGIASTAQRGANLLRWEGDELVWQLDAETRGSSIRGLFFDTGVERSSLSNMNKGAAKHVGIAGLEAVARHFGVGIADGPGNAPVSEYLLVWGPPRQPTVEVVDESPVAGEPSKVCKGIVCRKLNSKGVEKRLSAFPKSDRYSNGVGPICKACRREQERLRRENRKAAAAKTAKAAAKANRRKKAKNAPPPAAGA